MAQEHQQDNLWTPANKVTFARIVLIPLFVVILVAPWPDYFPSWLDMPTLKPWVAAAVFIVLSLTDMVDGYLARSREEVTDFGKFMDPLADKLLVTAALVGLVELNVVPSWPVLIIIAREFIVSGVRMVAASKGEVIAASWYGKVKTVLQMIAIVLFIIKDSHVIYSFSMLKSDWLYILSWAVMTAALIMTIISMFDYLYKARHLLGFAKGTDSAEQPILPTLEALTVQAEDVLVAARQRGALIATAESCTGGLISSTLTSIAGSSDVYLGGVVSYANEVKMELLNVQEATLASVGAVSEQTAKEMAEGVRKQLGADYAVSVTGIAGPGGEEPGKPVGTVWIGISSKHNTFAKHYLFLGTRSEVRAQTVQEALCMLTNAMQSELP